MRRRAYDVGDVNVDQGEPENATCFALGLSICGNVSPIILPRSTASRLAPNWRDTFPTDEPG